MKWHRQLAILGAASLLLGLTGCSGETILFYLVMSWKKGYYNKDLIGRHIMLKSWSKIQNKVRIEEITP